MVKSFKKAYRRKFKLRRLFEECQFCKNKQEPDYRKVDELRKFIRETGKITPRKINSCCAKHQRKLAKAVKRARHLALLSFSKTV